MKNFDYKNEAGRSMIEMLGVLAIIGVLSVGGIAGYSKAMTKYRINKTIEQITLIAGNIRAFFAPQGNYDGLSSRSDTGKAIIKKAKLVPDEMWDGDNIKSIWGEKFIITGVPSTDDNCTMHEDKAFIISISNIPVEACIEILTQDWSPLGVKSFYTMEANGDDNFIENVTTGQLTLDQAISNCYENESGNVQALELGFDTKSTATSPSFCN